jgi:WD40 repeat protein
MNPRLSPDGHLLAFQAMVDGITEVAVMKPESGNWNILTKRRDQGEVVGVSWSPDSSTIYFSRQTSVPQGVFSVPFLGGEERLVLEKAICSSPLSDGTLLIWRINPAGRMQLFHFWPETGRLQDLRVEAPPLAGKTKIGTSRDGRYAFVFGKLLGKSDQDPSLIEVDLAATSALPIAANGLSGLRTVAFAPDGTSAIATVGGGSLVRVVRIPLDGHGSLQELFTVTSDVWDMDAGPDGSVFLTLQDRPSELISIPADGGRPTKIASIPQQPGDLIGGLVALPDGRFVVESAVSGRSRLMTLEPGKMPAPLVNTSEETGNPLTAVAGNRIAFAIGSAPAVSIGVTDTSSGRIAGRISPHKGSLTSLAASPDGGTLFFTAGGAVWSVPTGGGEARRISAGDFVEVKPSDGKLVVARSESSQVRLFDVPPGGGAERAVPLDPAIHLFSPSTSPGQIRADGQMLAVLQLPDTWFNPLVLLGLKSGRVTRLAGDRVSDMTGPAFTRDGKIVAQRLLMYSTIWKFTPEKK